MSALQHPTEKPKTDSFTQFVLDNADVSICTIDGLNTFHSMGGIECVTTTPPNDPTSDHDHIRIGRSCFRLTNHKIRENPWRIICWTVWSCSH